MHQPASAALLAGIADTYGAPHGCTRFAVNGGMRGRVLVVEPYEAIRDLLRAALGRSEHDVEAVETGDEAIAALEREHFPCVVVGSPVVMKRGRAKLLFLEYIERHRPQWRPCLIVVTTHVEEGQIVAAAERLRVCAVLAKPFAADDLLDVVDGCLAGRHAPTRWIGVPDRSSETVTAAPDAVAPGVSK
jgi:DNA-binding NtrC family response regulator